MALTKKELIELALQESKEFSKDIRKYLHEASKERELTEQEKAFFEKTHEIHVRTIDAILLLREQNIE